MSPDASPGLADCWGDAFEQLYTQYETEGRSMQTIRARQLWFAILEAQVGQSRGYDVSAHIPDFLWYRLEIRCRPWQSKLLQHQETVVLG